MFPYSTAYGQPATTIATNVIKIGVNEEIGVGEIPTEFAQTVTYFADEVGKEVDERMKKYTTRIDELERELAIVGALEDTVRLLVAEVEELKNRNQVKKIFSYSHAGLLV